MGGAGHLATRRWFYLIPASGEPRALVHAIERYNLDHLPGSKTVYAGPRAAAKPAWPRCSTGVKRVAMEYSPQLRHPVRVARRRRHDRAGPRARRRRRVVRRPDPAVRGALERRGHRHASRRHPRSSIASRTRRSSSRRAAARRRADDRVRHPAADGRLVQGRRPGGRLGAVRLGPGERRQPALPGDRRRRTA